MLGGAPCLMMSASSRLLRTAVHVAAPRRRVSEASVYQPGLLTYLHFDPLHINRCRQEEAVIAGSVLRE